MIKMSYRKRIISFQDSVSNSVQFTHGHYYIGLPFKKAEVYMPNNWSVAVQ